MHSLPSLRSLPIPDEEPAGLPRKGTRDLEIHAIVVLTNAVLNPSILIENRATPRIALKYWKQMV